MPATKKRDAIELWTHTGPLAEAMRADATVKMTPAAFAAASMDTTLRNDDVTVKLVDGVRVYLAGKKELATLALEGETLVLQFLAPKQRDDLDPVAHLYKPVPGRPGWLEFRRPATRDPKPALAANLGLVLGQASFERSKKK